MHVFGTLKKVLWAALPLSFSLYVCNNTVERTQIRLFSWLRFCHLRKEIKTKLAVFCTLPVLRLSAARESVYISTCYLLQSHYWKCSNGHPTSFRKSCLHFSNITSWNSCLHIFRLLVRFNCFFFTLKDGIWLYHRFLYKAWFISWLVCSEFLCCSILKQWLLWFVVLFKNHNLVIKVAAQTGNWKSVPYLCLPLHPVHYSDYSNYKLMKKNYIAH